MALNIETLRDMVDSTIYSNDEKEITGAALNNALHSLIDAIEEASKTGSSGSSGGGGNNYFFPTNVYPTIKVISSSSSSSEEDIYYTFTEEEANVFLTTMDDYKNVSFRLNSNLQELFNAMYPEGSPEREEIMADPEAALMLSMEMEGMDTAISVNKTDMGAFINAYIEMMNNAGLNKEPVNIPIGQYYVCSFVLSNHGLGVDIKELTSVQFSQLVVWINTTTGMVEAGNGGPIQAEIYSYLTGLGI